MAADPSHTWVLCPRSTQIQELTLKSQGTTELRILFDEPWLVQVSYARLKGDMPLDREAGAMCALSSEFGQGWPLAGRARFLGAMVAGK